MAVDHIRYDLLAQAALRGVLRTVLSDAAKNGLPGEHHFYITFDTRSEGVRLSQRMRAQYPEEMTIVLQHQFWDLVVSDEAFEVGLSFGGIPERLVIPFGVVKSFFDPSVQFGLQFEQIGAETAGDGAKEASPPKKSAGEQVPAEPKRAAPGVAAVPAPANLESDDSGHQPDKPLGGGEVVRLDRFRKK
jgi:hypothetical protein